MTTDLPRLLKRVYRFRQAARRRGIARLFARRRKAALLSEFARLWRGGYVLTVEGDLAFLPTPLDSDGERVLLYGWRVPPPALAFAPAGGVAIDVGANLGEWAVPLAKAVGPQGRLLAIEANPPIANALAATLRINRLTHASVLALALSDQDGSGTLSVDPAHTGLSRLSAADANGIAVPLRRLDDIVVEQGLSRLDLVKIDVEGHERQVLAGAAETLSRLRPAIIFETGHETAEDRAAIAALLGRLDYDIVAALHDYGALACGVGDYAAASGACTGREATNLLALPRLLSP